MEATSFNVAWGLDWHLLLIPFPLWYSQDCVVSYCSSQSELFQQWAVMQSRFKFALFAYHAPLALKSTSISPAIWCRRYRRRRRRTLIFWRPAGALLAEDGSDDSSSSGDGRKEHPHEFDKADHDGKGKGPSVQRVWPQDDDPGDCGRELHEGRKTAKMFLGIRVSQKEKTIGWTTSRELRKRTKRRFCKFWHFLHGVHAGGP